MLKPVSAVPAVVVCSTCRHSPQSRHGPDGISGGAALGSALRKVQGQDNRYSAIEIQDMACLFACREHCTVHLRAPGRMSYVLGRFAPDEAAARAILDYALHYASSKEGIVPYANWPEGVKGHFITRCPPCGFVAE